MNKFITKQKLMFVSNLFYYLGDIRPNYRFNGSNLLSSNFKGKHFCYLNTIIFLKRFHSYRTKTPSAAVLSAVCRTPRSPTKCNRSPSSTMPLLGSSPVSICVNRTFCSFWSQVTPGAVSVVHATPGHLAGRFNLPLLLPAIPEASF